MTRVGLLSSTQEITGLDGLTVGDFWSWAFSDVMSNLNRSMFAEFLVASALGLLDVPRVEWDAVDLRFRGASIEVKAAAYVQSWPQSRPSPIRFEIAKKLAWHAQTNTYATERTRNADCYVFCLYPETDPSRANVLDVGAWEFYVLSTERINRQLGEQKSVGISRIRAMCESVGYRGLKEQVCFVLEIPAGGDSS